MVTHSAHTPGAMAAAAGIADVMQLVQADVMVQIRKEFDRMAQRKGGTDTALTKPEFVLAILKHVPRSGAQRTADGVSVGSNNTSTTEEEGECGG